MVGAYQMSRRHHLFAAGQTSSREGPGAPHRLTAGSSDHEHHHPGTWARVRLQPDCPGDGRRPTIWPKRTAASRSRASTPRRRGVFALYRGGGKSTWGRTRSAASASAATSGPTSWSRSTRRVTGAVPHRSLLHVTAVTGPGQAACYPGAVAQQGRVAGVDVMADDRDARIAQLEAKVAALRVERRYLHAGRPSCRADRGAGAADGDRRGAAGDRLLAGRPPAVTRRDRRERALRLSGS